jgi:hypothetical protein
MGCKMLVSRDWKNLPTKKCHEMGLESSSGADNTAKHAQQNEPDATRWVRGPFSRTRKFAMFPPETGPYKSAPVSTIARPP